MWPQVLVAVDVVAPHDDPHGGKATRLPAMRLQGGPKRASQEPLCEPPSWGAHFTDVNEEVFLWNV